MIARRIQWWAFTGPIGGMGHSESCHAPFFKRHVNRQKHCKHDNLEKICSAALHLEHDCVAGAAMS